MNDCSTLKICKILLIERSMEKESSFNIREVLAIERYIGAGCERLFDFENSQVFGDRTIDGRKGMNDCSTLKIREIFAIGR